MDGPRADDNLSSLDLLPGGGPHARRPPSLEQHPIHEHIAAHLEVRPNPSGLEVGVAGGYPPAFTQRQRHTADPAGLRRG